MSKKILVVDDEPDVSTLFRQKYRHQIRSGELCFEFANNGQQALKALEKDTQISVVFTDLNMPGMDGMTFLKHANQLERPLVLVVVSAYGDMVNIRTAMNLGAFDFLTKPINFQDFALTLQKCMEQVAHKQALEDEKKKTSFFTAMSHELRTPLHAIIGYSELLEEGFAEKDQAKAIQDVQRIGVAGKHLLKLIDNLLDLSKIEHGMMAIYSEKVCVTRLVTEVIDTLKPMASDQANQLIFQPQQQNLHITVDSTKLRQILLNLIGNALKYTQNGHVDVALVHTEIGEKPALSFKVSDTGIGLSPKHLRQLFKPYQQARSSVGNTYGGTGLGLVICKEYIELMGGHLNVVSSLGTGSTFTVTLPIEPDCQSGKGTQTAEEPSEA